MYRFIKDDARDKESVFYLGTGIEQGVEGRGPEKIIPTDDVGIDDDSHTLLTLHNACGIMWIISIIPAPRAKAVLDQRTRVAPSKIQRCATHI